MFLAGTDSLPLLAWPSAPAHQALGAATTFASSGGGPGPRTLPVHRMRMRSRPGGPDLPGNREGGAQTRKARELRFRGNLASLAKAETNERWQGSVQPTR